VMQDMPRPRPPYLHRERTRHGRMVWYVRINRQSPRIRLYAGFGTPEFMEEYQAALDGKKLPKRSHAVRHGSLEWLVNQWKATSDWLLTQEATKRQRENILKHVLDKNGSLPFARMTVEDICKGRDKRLKTPAAANNFLKTMRALFKWACLPEVGHAKSNPAAVVKLIPLKGEGHKPWTHEDVQAYRARWPLGTTQRLALEILLWTGIRRGDLARLGRQHIRDGVISMKTEKKSRRHAEGVQLDIPIFKPLQEAIDAMPVTTLSLITGARGEKITKETLGNYFADWCKTAGVDPRAHGLRKLAATMAAESDATDKELQAYFGWLTNTQSARYTERANRTRLARSAGQKLAGEHYSLTSHQVRELEEKSIPDQGDTDEDKANGGRYWTRTSDPCDVNTVLYQLS
jgi:integrase